MVDHVLGRFSKEERELVEEAIVRAADSVEVSMKEGFEKAMNIYNKREKLDASSSRPSEGEE